MTEQDGPQEAPEVPVLPQGVLEPARGSGGRTAPLAVDEVVGLNGKPAKVPGGVWFAATDGTGALATDDQGRPVRVRSPHRPPRVPLGG